MTRGLTKKIEKFFKHYRSVSYEAGQIVLPPNKQITKIYYIDSGTIRQYIVSSENEKLTLQLFKPHAFIPLAMFLNATYNQYTYQAITPTKVRIAPVEEVVTFLKENPDVLFDLTTRLSQATAGLLQNVELTAFNDAYTRILSLLIHLGVKFGEKRGKECFITIPFSHYDIASMLGMQRETISRQLVLMKEKGVIRYEGDRIVLVNLAEARWDVRRKTTLKRKKVKRDVTNELI